MDTNTVHCGDCLELMKEIPDGSIDMILCDLPYGVTKCKWDTVIPLEPLWEQYKRIVKPNAAIVLTASQPFTSKLVMSNLKWFKYEWIWIKSQATGHLNCYNMPFKNVEDICVFCNKSTKYNPLIENKPIKNIRISKGGHNKVNSFCYGKYYEVSQENRKIPSDKTLPKQTLYFNNCQERLHPTQKPVALFEYLIKTYTNEGDLVLDNCAGSGTTGVACQNLNRNFILIEKDEKYCEVINERLSKPRQQCLLS